DIVQLWHCHNLETGEIQKIGGGQARQDYFLLYMRSRKVFFSVSVVLKVKHEMQYEVSGYAGHEQR
ncbi:MAG: hypothetical protein ACWGOX_15330, partial [Desulforhopalus sp.]